MEKIDWSKAPEWADRAVEWMRDTVFFSDGVYFLNLRGDWVLHGGVINYDDRGEVSDWWCELGDTKLIETRPDPWQEGEERMNNIAQNGNDGHYGAEISSSKYKRYEILNDEPVKKERYKKENGMDKIDEWARDKTHDQFRTIMWAMCEKYESRLGKKDAIVKEVGKMADYMNRWHLYEQKWAEE